MNDIDPLLHEAMANVKGPVDLHPSVSDVHRRARRHYRRRMADLRLARRSEHRCARRSL